ncbi:MAG: ATP-binding protein [Alphaproteobacteria bacterium]|nr:ATP-binding protein [Alphaproteobacteria bacterium]
MAATPPGSQRPVRLSSQPAGQQRSLVERRTRSLGRVVSHFTRVIKLLSVDEPELPPLRATDAELLFQVLSERTEQRSIMLTTNLPDFSEWTKHLPEHLACAGP